MPFSQYPADLQKQFSGSDKAHVSLPEGSAKQIVMQAQAWKPVSVLLPFTPWMWVGPVKQSNTSLTPLPAPHYPQCFTRYQPLPLPSLTQRKRKKKMEDIHPHCPPKTISKRRQYQADSPLPAQAGEVVQCQLRCFKPWWILSEALYFLLWCPALGFDRPNPTDLRRSAKNLHLRWYRCRPTIQKEYISVYRINLFVAEQDNFEKKKLNPLNPTNPNSITCTGS